MADDRALEDPAAAIGRLDGALEDLKSTLLARMSRRPTGDIEQTIRSTPKADTLMMQGQTVARATYPALWQWVQDQGLVVAGLFTVGDGSTTFGLPDLRGRVPIGAGTLGADTYAVGATGGAAARVLATANLPAHTHSVALSQHEGHSHAISGHTGHAHSDYADGGHGGHFPTAQILAASGSALGLAAWNSSGATLNHHQHGMSIESPGNHTESIEGGGKPHTVTESSVGSGTAFDNRMAYLAVNWLIWT